MDILYFLRMRLRFLERMYTTCCAPFREIMRKIQDGEEPYVDRRDPEHCDEPAYVQEWMEASEAVEVIGRWCVAMLGSSLFAYLSEWLAQFAEVYQDATLIADFAKAPGKPKLERYCHFMRDRLHIDWDRSPVGIDRLEQTILARNDFEHSMGLVTLIVCQDEKHRIKYPRSLFCDELSEEGVQSGLPSRLTVDQTRFTTALGDVLLFCRWLEYVRVNYGPHMYPASLEAELPACLPSE